MPHGLYIRAGNNNFLFIWLETLPSMEETTDEFHPHLTEGANEYRSR